MDENTSLENNINDTSETSEANESVNTDTPAEKTEAPATDTPAEQTGNSDTSIEQTDNTDTPVEKTEAVTTDTPAEQTGNSDTSIEQTDNTDTPAELTEAPATASVKPAENTETSDNQSETDKNTKQSAEQAETIESTDTTNEQTETAEAEDSEKSSLILSILYSIGNFLLFNIVFILLMVPVVTIGAAFTAYYDIAFTKRIDHSRKNFSVKNLLNKFRVYFKISTSYFICYLLVIGFLVALALLFSPIGPLPYKLVSVLFILLSGFAFSILMYTFPILAINSVSSENEVIEAQRARARKHASEDSEDSDVSNEEALSNYMLRFSNVDEAEENSHKDLAVALKEADELEYYNNQNSVGNIILDAIYYAAKHFIRLMFILCMFALPAGILYVFYDKTAVIITCLILFGVRLILSINAGLYYSSFFEYEEEDFADIKTTSSEEDSADDSEDGSDNTDVADNSDDSSDTAEAAVDSDNSSDTAEATVDSENNTDNIVNSGNPDTPDSADTPIDMTDTVIEDDFDNNDIADNSDTPVTDNNYNSIISDNSDSSEASEEYEDYEIELF
ncbi:Protein of unknown function, DUF624 [Eubacterium ruminantium]|nr:Protein of unknown function, DUF624 [Eubacterium ruminantium]